MPTWDPKNLARHHQKRVTRDKGCFEDLMGIHGRDMMDAEYEQRSQEAYNKAWAEYECVSWDADARAYRPPAAYFADEELVIAITDLARANIITCFHQHFSGPHSRVAALPIGQRKLRYAQAIQWRVQGRQILQLQRIRGV